MRIENMMTYRLNIIFLVINQCYSLPKKPNILMIVADDLGWADVPWHDPTIYAPRWPSYFVNFISLMLFFQDKRFSRKWCYFKQQLCAASVHSISCCFTDWDVSVSSWKTAQGSQAATSWRNTNWVQIVA